MLNIREYHRPAELEAALALLLRRDVRTVPLAGGSDLVGRADPAIEAVVDLQDTGLDYIHADADSLHLGAMARLQQLVDSPLVRVLVGGLVARAAHHTTSSILRHQATLGGTLIAARDADLIPSLLVLDAEVVVRAPGERRLPLGEFCRSPQRALGGGLLIEVRVPTPPGATGAGYARVSRTPADLSIVGVAARLTGRNGRCSEARLAACGAAPFSVRLTGAEALLEGKHPDAATIAAAAEAARAAVAPLSDYRGSAEYRREMVAVLAARAMREAWENID